MDDFLIKVQKALSASSADSPTPPARIAMHPETWYAVVRAIRDHRMTFTAAPVPRPTLFGMEVVEDPSLSQGAWRFEHR